PKVQGIFALFETMEGPMRLDLRKFFNRTSAFALPLAVVLAAGASSLGFAAPPNVNVRTVVGFFPGAGITNPVATLDVAAIADQTSGRGYMMGIDSSDVGIATFDPQLGQLDGAVLRTPAQRIDAAWADVPRMIDLYFVQWQPESVELPTA